MKADISFTTDSNGKRNAVHVALFVLRGQSTKVEVSASRPARRDWGEAVVRVPALNWTTPELVDRLALALVVALKLTPLINKNPWLVRKGQIKEKILEAESYFSLINPFEEG